MRRESAQGPEDRNPSHEGEEALANIASRSPKELVLQAGRPVIWYSAEEHFPCAETEPKPYRDPLVSRGWIEYGGSFGTELTQWGAITEVAP